jgi:hypothetical protein
VRGRPGFEQMSLRQECAYRQGQKSCRRRHTPLLRRRRLIRLRGMIGGDRVMRYSELHLAPQTAVPTAVVRLCPRPRHEITPSCRLSFQAGLSASGLQMHSSRRGAIWKLLLA